MNIRSRCHVVLAVASVWIVAMVWVPQTAQAAGGGQWALQETGTVCFNLLADARIEGPEIISTPQPLQEVCRAFQACSPIGGYVDPVPAPMPGYASELVMAGGTFIDGSTSEFSADGPLREPYVLYSQGGTHRAHAALALAAALTRLEGCPTD